MLSQEDMKRALQAYIDGFAAGDAAAVSDLFAADAVIEDPVGTPPVHGRPAIDEFYANAIAAGSKLTLDGPIRGSHGNQAAMAFTVEVPAMNMRIRAIDVMTFGEDGKVVEMRALWGPDDIES
ncbi:nuclear transport factor 2 family protein [Actinomadura parmotrematis]|uniref:Nuclear transport factor 2 family protein n=1 Tax=Actinomadura parmotrematis TaxID=2864039 RepID=A0ABS7FWV3_9ACTN|nr:nuclear transport factor 2 family protein [Actinomadura parmotrematis]MBW8484904.1 nuclear transport factor 2 family protein [Actinomadura parmotrematis]